MTTRYKDAVAFATDWLQQHMRNGEIAPFEVEPTELVYALGLGVEQRFDDHPICPAQYLIGDHALMWLCWKADIDRGAFELARRIVGSKLMRSEPLPPDVSMFAGMIVAGLKTPPRSERQRLSKTFAANLHLLRLARAVSTHFKLDLTRNDAMDGHGISASDVVSEALQNIGIYRNPRAIKDLLVHQSHRRVREIADELEEVLRHGPYPVKVMDTER